MTVPATATRAGRRRSWWRPRSGVVVELVMLGAVLVAVAVTRVPTLRQPLLEAHGFRQTQTAWQAVEFHRLGIDLLHPRVPVLGTPWEIPFELPLFQAMASIPMSWGISADVAVRATAVGCFAVTAVLLWALVRRLAGPVAAVAATVVFAFSPFALLWSRAAMIEYLATAATLGWVLAAVAWRGRPRWWWLGLAVVAGILACTVKLTTAGPWLLPILLYSAEGDPPGPGGWVRARLRVPFVLLAALPVAAGLAWTGWADHVKGSSDATAWLRTSELREFTLGTLHQRLQWGNWSLVLDRVESLLVGRAFGVAIVVAGLLLVRRHRAFWLGVAAVPVASVAVFFNLYVVHDYYLAAPSPALAALLGIGIGALAERAFVHRARLVPFAAGASVLGWVAWSLWTTSTYWGTAYDALAVPVEPQLIAAYTEPGDRVVVTGTQWSPHVHYYADRYGVAYDSRAFSEASLGRLPDIARYRGLFALGGAADPVELARARPWIAPMTDRYLLLGSTEADLGDAPVVATTGASPSGARIVEPSTLECGGEPLRVPPGTGTAWVRFGPSEGGRLDVGGGRLQLPVVAAIGFRPDPVTGRRAEAAVSCPAAKAPSVAVLEVVEQPATPR